MTVEKMWMLCSGYGGAGEDMMLLELQEDGSARKAGGFRWGMAPSFCCQAGGKLYAVSERGDGASVARFSLEDGISLEKTIEIPGGRGLCHLYPLGNALVGSCYESGLFFAVDQGLEQVLWRFQPQGAPHAHWAQQEGGGLLLADLGGDCLYRFSLSGGLPAGGPQPLRLKEGSGPRQPLPLPQGGFAVVCELDGGLRFFDGGGRLAQEEPASASGQPNWPGGACLLGDVLLVGNRGPNTISAFRVGGAGAQRLGEWPTGNWPRHLAALPQQGLVFAACQRENAVCAYRWQGEALAPLWRLPLEQASCVLPLAR